MKKFITLLICFVIFLSTFSACGTQSDDTVKANDIKVWTIDINEKVVQNQLEEYQSYYNQNSLEIFGARNEKESGQITLTAIDGDITSYDVQVSDLTSASGNAFSKDNVQVFNEKYFTVQSASEHYKTSGEYPDALLPFEKAVEYGENKVSKGNNQTVMVRFDIPENQPFGEYKGNIKVIANEKSFDVPVSLYVFNVTVSEEVHSKSAFAVSWGMERGEFDHSMDMRIKYFEFLAEYMVSGFEMFKDGEYNEETIKEWVNIYTQLYPNPKISTMRLPKLTKTFDSYYIGETEYNDFIGIDYELTSKILTLLSKKCIEDNVNYMSKLFIRGMDEPVVNKKTDAEIIAFHDTAYKIKTLTIDDLNKNYRNEQNSAFIDEIIQSIDKLAIVTTEYVVRDNSEYISYCPYYNCFQSEGSRKEYAEKTYNELWWYGCNVPVSPYPNYHIDDSVLSARLLSWMQFNYGVVGNLYWATDNWASRTDANAPLYDYYNIDTALEPGEGILLYPGKYYGIDGPIPSIRLEAVRDGLEEYELLRSMELKYKSINEEYSFMDMMNLLVDSLYFGVQVSYDLDAFKLSRKTLYTLCEACENADFVITDVVSNNGKYSIKLFAKDGAEIKSFGKALTPTKSYNGGNEYLLEFTLSSQSSGINVDLTYGGKTYDIDWYLGSSSKAYGAEELNGCFVKGNSSNVVGTSVVEASTLGLTDGGNYLQLRLSPTNGAVQCALLSNEAITKVGSGTKKIVFNIYFDGEENETQYLRIQFKYKNEKIYSEKIVTELKKGLNTFEINNIYSYDWKKYGGLENVYFGFTKSKDEVTKEITKVYVKDISIFDK